MMELDADVLVVGGGLGGVAAALAAARHGSQVVLTEQYEWLGGQLTSQAVPPDEHRWVEQFGITRSYRELRDGIRRYYRQNYPLTERARRWRELNPVQVQSAGSATSHGLRSRSWMRCWRRTAHRDGFKCCSPAYR
jgi:glycine/D-amino acid oxidase-like deaminating enzyme